MRTVFLLEHKVDSEKLVRVRWEWGGVLGRMRGRAYSRGGGEVKEHSGKGEKHKGAFHR